MAGWLLGSALEPSRRDHPFVRFWAPGRAAASGRPGPWPRPCLAGSRICCHHILDVMQRPRMSFNGVIHTAASCRYSGIEHSETCRIGWPHPVIDFSWGQPAKQARQEGVAPSIGG